MGKSRTTRSAAARGSSLPPPGSSSDLRSFFPPTDMPQTGTAKMAPDPSAAYLQRSARNSPTPHSPQRTPIDPGSAPLDSTTGLRNPGAVSPPSRSPPHEASQQGPQDTMPPSLPQQYTQCSEAFPRLLRTASDPCLHGTEPDSPTSSVLSMDFPALPAPMHPANCTIPEPAANTASHNRIEPASPPPKAQKMALPQALDLPRDWTIPQATYAHKVSLPDPRFQRMDATRANPSAQTPTWSEPWDSPLGTAHQALGLTASDPPPLPPRTPSAQWSALPEHPQPALPQWQTYLQAIPTKEDFRQLIEDVKSTCRSEIQVLQSGLKHLADRVEMAEEEIQETKLAVHRTQLQGADHHTMLRDMQRHVEDLDNRGRRNNIRVRGIPEVDGPEDIQHILQDVFNNLLGEPVTKFIEMDRAHRALRPKNATTQPRDIICRINSYPLKEDIMRQARLARRVTYKNAQVQLYPDLSWITLQKRRLLQPLLRILQEENIPYRWGFPFSLTAKNQGRSAVLRYPEDIQAFCNTVGISVPRLPEWDLITNPPAPPATWQKVSSSNRSRNKDASRKNTKHGNG